MRLAASALIVVGLLAVPAAATHKKPVSQSYDVTAPVPYPLDGASHCSEGVEGLTKNTRPFTIPEHGVLEIELSGFLGDWVLELHDDEGRMLAQAAELDLANTDPLRKIVFKKGKPKQEVAIAVCNVNGGPRASVSYTFTYR